MSLKIDKQVLYMGKWIDPNHFAAFVHSKTERRLVQSWKAYTDLISTGIWFDLPPTVEQDADKPEPVRRTKKCQPQTNQQQVSEIS